METKREKPIPKFKIKVVQELSDLMKNKKTILVASIKNIPASQFQEICKKLRGKAIVKVPKKNLTLRAIESMENKEMIQIKEHLGESMALLFSDLDSYDLARELMESKSPSKAKSGQEAPEDIEIPEGPTELVPGPAISELGALGIQIKIENGKINIQKAKVIAKKGEKISQGAADLMSKLDIKPFSIGFNPILSYDTKENKLYLEIIIDKESVLNEIRTEYRKSLALSVEIGYICEDNIKIFLGKAGAHAKVIEDLVSVEGEKPKEEGSDNAEEKKDNNKTSEVKDSLKAPMLEEKNKKEDNPDEKTSKCDNGDEVITQLSNSDDQELTSTNNTQSGEKSDKENMENK